MRAMIYILHLKLVFEEKSNMVDWYSQVGRVERGKVFGRAKLFEAGVRENYLSETTGTGVLEVFHWVLVT